MRIVQPDPTKSQTHQIQIQNLRPMQTQLEIIEPAGSELANLIERESRIERCQRNAYYEIGLELKAIRDAGLYKIQREAAIGGRYSFTTFEEYCSERWEMNRERGRQLIEAADAVSKMPTIVGILPSRESHVRALLKLEEDNDRAEVWRRVSTSGDSITAKYVSEEVEKFQAEKKKDWITLDEWRLLEADVQESKLKTIGDKTFNKQDSDNIEWARWSWNPVTGCNHGCKYCYARDIAARFYPQGFKPTIIPARLTAPQNTNPRDTSNMSEVDQMGWRNVFVCSMADLFGKWVPSAWIQAVLDQCAKSPQWNYLFLSKFPQRMAEFEFPDNAWSISRSGFRRGQSREGIYQNQSQDDVAIVRANA